MKKYITSTTLAGLLLLTGADIVSAEVNIEDPVQQRIDALLARMDKNKDGAIDRAEAGRMWARLSSADANEDGKVTEKEMHDAWSGSLQLTADDDVVQRKIDGLLLKFDKNKDGAIDRKEAGERMWLRLSGADADEDGKVTSKEMYQAWS